MLYAIHYAGEGADLLWYRGSTYEEGIVARGPSGEAQSTDGVEVISRAEYVWWAKVRNAAGQVGWTRATGSFRNVDRCG